MIDQIAESFPVPPPNNGGSNVSVEKTQRRKNLAEDYAFWTDEASEKFLDKTREVVKEEWKTDIGNSDLDTPDEMLGLNIKHAQAVEQIVNEAVAVLNQYHDHSFTINPAQHRIMKFYAWVHDVKKFNPARHKKELVAQGKIPEKERKGLATREKLLNHGEDAASWLETFLAQHGFSDDFIVKAQTDVQAHMGMPYVVNELNQVQAEGVSIELPKNLPDGTYPLPSTVEATVLFAADLLTPKIMAGENIENDPQAGCFDRYVRLGLQRGDNLVKAFYDAEKSLFDNVSRLINPPEEESRGEIAQIERILGTQIGTGAVDEVRQFRKFITTNTKEYPQGLISMEVRMPDRSLNFDATMNNYYHAVAAFRGQPKTQ